MAIAAVKARFARWLFRHPLVVVFLLLLATTAAAFSLARILESSSAGPSPSFGLPVGRPAQSTLPTPTQTAPAMRVDRMHRALHGLDRVCRGRVPDPGGARLRRHTETMLQFARDYPDAGFKVDDETGSTLSLLVVLHDELRSCAPQFVPAVEELLPAQFRDPR